MVTENYKCGLILILMQFSPSTGAFYKMSYKYLPSTNTVFKLCLLISPSMKVDVYISNVSSVGRSREISSPEESCFAPQGKICRPLSSTNLSW